MYYEVYKYNSSVIIFYLNKLRILLYRRKITLHTLKYFTINPNKN